MILSKLLEAIPVVEILGSVDLEISRIISDSRKSSKGSLYVATRGVSLDGHAFIDAAIQGGARCIVCENIPENRVESITYIRVKSSSVALAHLAKNFFGDPSQKIGLVGITGTNGKTSTASLLFEAFSLLGFKSALISTVEYRIGSEVFPSTHTTPDILQLNEILSQAVKQDCQYVFMEVSSHGIHQNRIEALSFKVAGFTNITRDHLDYHKTFSEYLGVKKRFFDTLTDQSIAITNVDDKNGMFVLQNTKAIKKTYALKRMADYHGKILESDFNGTQVRFGNKEFWTKLVGRHNIYNLLLVFAIASELGLEEDNLLKVLSCLSGVKGRFETVRSSSGVFLVVDYAHTPDALDNVLSTMNEILCKGEGRLICVFGCGGNRDRGKRREMGKIATEKSRVVIVTSDNPRDEDPLRIIEEIEGAVQRDHLEQYFSIPDRREAIEKAIRLAKKGDVILVAGKGHETYQEIRGKKYYFNDREVAEEIFSMIEGQEA